MQAQERRAVQRKQDLDVISVRRNPYLVDFEEQRRPRQAVKERSRRPAGTACGRNHRQAATGVEKSYESLDLIDIRTRRKAAGKAGQQPRRFAQQPADRRINISSADRKRNSGAVKKIAERRRRKQMIRRKCMAAAWVLCIFLIGWLFLVKKGNASELELSGAGQRIADRQEEKQSASSTIIQGISSDQYAKHPAWTEDFLPMNAYSRPGEALPAVRDIFVHYTANPGTSAAQNHSYFEQQKDMHEASVSAHFIIGYEGEIIQCVPLDEIAYAVQTRNYDSVSIECCYQAQDGSFTQETYDALISLLVWLTETYDLDTDHILRHYDCGGKKCPLYYTEHEDAWVQLKADVRARQE